MSEPPFLRALALRDLPVNSMRSVELGGRRVLLCHTAQGVFAVDEICTHGEARLGEGRLRGVRVICPLHGASFDCRTGAVLGAPATAPLARHATRLADGWIEVALAGTAAPATPTL
jgi:3-phenylpropionate/trans-cinnamate dioxygenase ferredoxin subunit